jgi:hypothetical protein
MENAQGRRPSGNSSAADRGRARKGPRRGKMSSQDDAARPAAFNDSPRGRAGEHFRASEGPPARLVRRTGLAGGREENEPPADPMLLLEPYRAPDAPAWALVPISEW